MKSSPDIDWRAVHATLRENERRLAEAFAPAEEGVELALKQRAAALASRRPLESARLSSRTILVLRAGGHVAGVELRAVKEVLRTSGHATVPDAHASILGVINVHNELTCLLDPYVLLHETAPAEDAPFTHAVLLAHPHLRIAIACHEVMRLEEIPDAHEQPSNVFRSEGRTGTVLDLESLLATWDAELHSTTSSSSSSS